MQASHLAGTFQFHQALQLSSAFNPEERKGKHPEVPFLVAPIPVEMLWDYLPGRAACNHVPRHLKDYRSPLIVSLEEMLDRDTVEAFRLNRLA